MADRFLRVNAAAELALNSDSDESMLEKESDAEDIDEMDFALSPLPKDLLFRVPFTQSILLKV